MKTLNRTLSAAVALALSGAGIAYALADTQAATPPPSSMPTAAAPAPETEKAVANDRDEGPMEVSQTFSGGPSPKQSARMSEDGLQAVHDIHLARIALNDGYTQNAKKLLDEAKELLDKVQKTDRPVTVSTDVKVGTKDVEKDKTTVTPDLIPILSELQLVEEYDPSPAKIEAVKKAREHMGKGERKEAIETLKLAEVGLVSHEVAVPLSETIGWVSQSLKLMDAGKLHEANLELKKVSDGLVQNTTVLAEPPVAAADQPAGDKAQSSTQPSGHTPKENAAK